MALPKLNNATYELTLPSTGEQVKYRPFLVKEQKALMIAQESEDPVSSTIRINFQASREQGGTVKYAGSTHSMKFFQSFFAALDKSLFLDVNLESGEATIVEEN